MALLEATVRAAAARALPEYMRPSALVAVESLPLGASGKVDLKALPDPQRWGELGNGGGGGEGGEGGAGGEGGGFVAPREGLEARLAEIWSEVLGLDPSEERLGAGDDFWRVGGNSLLAGVALSRVSGAWGTRGARVDKACGGARRECANPLVTAGGGSRWRRHR